jgi:hypothetical protein
VAIDDDVIGGLLAQLRLDQEQTLRSLMGARGTTTPASASTDDGIAGQIG